MFSSRYAVFEITEVKITRVDYISLGIRGYLGYQCSRYRKIIVHVKDATMYHVTKVNYSGNLPSCVLCLHIGQL